MPQSQHIDRLGFWPCRRPRSSPTHLASLTYTLARPPNQASGAHRPPCRPEYDHLQRARSPHELSFTPRPQDNKRPSLSWQGGAQSTICAREPALGSNHGLRPEMSPTRPRAIFATATRHAREGLYHSHHVSWAATPAQLNPPTRYLLPDKGAGAPAHSYAPAPHSRQSALEATQPHLTARRPRPHSRPLLLPHAHHGRSTARRPLAEKRHLRTNTRPSSCSPSHRAAAAMEHISTKVAG